MKMVKKLTIEEMQSIAESRGGKCLSKVYLRVDKKLKWQCSKGHIWEAVPNNIKYGGTWCPECASKKKLTIEEMKSIAKQKGGKCLSKEYFSTDKKLKWECSKGHIWKVAINDIKYRGNWCPECAGNKKLKIEEMWEIAKSRGGKCLSEVYLRVDKKLKWQCNKGHIWKATTNDIKYRGNWCPECASNKSEKITRYFMQRLFGNKFNKYKPKFLYLSKNSKLELDGYNKELQIAFEYDGRQHFMYVRFNKHKVSKEKQERILEQTKKYDKLKDRLCKENGVFLIRVPYTVKHKDIGNYIVDVCDKNNIEVPFRHLVNEINYNEFYDIGGVEIC